MKKQSLQLNSDEIRLQSFNKSKTEKVLQKWTSDEGEIQEEDIRKAASNYARLEINNRILKWIIVVVIVFLFVLLGFMIASVVIGVNITKDITVKNGVLVTNSGTNSVIQTSNMKYVNKINLQTPADVIDTMKTITLTVNEGLYSAVIQFDVVSYVYIPGKKLTFYGHTHMADIQPDGTVKYELLIPFDVKRDGSTSTGTSGSASGSSSSTSSTNNVVSIGDCNTLKTINCNGQYSISQSFSCDISSNGPICSSFTGSIDGLYNNLTITGGPLFTSFSGSISRLNIQGSSSGTDQCGVIATTAYGGSFLSQVGVYSSLGCTPSGNAGSSQVAGGFFAYVVVDPSNPTAVVTIQGSVFQGTITYNSDSAIVSCFVGQESSSTSIVTFSYNACGANFVTGPSTSTSHLAFLNNGNADVQYSTNFDFCIVNPSSTYDFSDCFPIPSSVTLASSDNSDGVFHYPLEGQSGFVTPAILQSTC